MRALYLCYFGLAEPLVQTQVLPYLRELARGGMEMHLLTFEPVQSDAWRDAHKDAWQRALQEDGIHWNCLRYHKRPTLPATAYDILRGAWFAWRLNRRLTLDVLHARSHVPAVIGAIVKRLTGARLIFDVRGLLLEEYVDAGVWPAGGFLYRLSKRAERALLHAADGFVILTEPCRTLLFPGGNSASTDADVRAVQVIPCCVDTRRFTPADLATRLSAKARLGLTGRQVFVHLGALDGWVATDALAEIIAAARRRDPTICALFLTQSSVILLEHALARRQIRADDYVIRRVAPGEVPAYLSAADVGVAAYVTSGAKRASSPTKIAEYLAMGLPVVCTEGVGDLDDIVEHDRVGVIVRGFDAASCDEALARLDVLLRDHDLQERCRNAAVTRFDLEQVGGPAYRRIYERVLARPS